MTEKPSIKPPRTSLDKNTILIGQKPVMRYVNAIVMRLGEGSEVIIRARGRAIPTAVDAAQVSCRRFFGGKLAVSNVSIGTAGRA